MCVSRVHLYNYGIKKHTKKNHVLQKKRPIRDRDCIPTFFYWGDSVPLFNSRLSFKDLAKSLWDSCAYFKVSFHLISLSYFRNFPVGWKRGTEPKQGFTLLELSGEVQSCIYHLSLCHPQLINCISCQWRTLKVTVEIKKNKTNSQVDRWHSLPYGALQIILKCQMSQNLDTLDESSSGL